MLVSLSPTDTTKYLTFSLKFFWKKSSLCSLKITKYIIFVYTSCSQATVVLTSKHFAQRQPWLHCVAATLRFTAAVSNWSWMLLLLFWGLVTSARPWGQLSQPPRGPWLPRAEPCPPSSGPYWPTLSPWCSKLCYESFPMLSVLIEMTNTVGIQVSIHILIDKICFRFPTFVCSFSHLTDCFPLPCYLFHLLVCFTLLLFVVFHYLIIWLIFPHINNPTPT